MHELAPGPRAGKLLSGKQKMDFERLRKIVDWMVRSPLSELEIVDGDFKVHLVRDAKGVAPAGSDESPISADPAGHEVLAATYGVVHLAPDIASPPFVAVGQSVEPGQTLCVIEAMKVFNPIEAGEGGTIAEILVADGDEVTAGQPLFRLE